MVSGVVSGTTNSGGGGYIALYPIFMRSHISKLVADAKLYPSRDFTEEIEALSKRLATIVESHRRELLCNFLLILYEFDYEECMRGITKCMLLNPEQLKVTPTERNRLLAVCWFVITQTFPSEDYSLILDNLAEHARGTEELPYQ